MDTAKSEQREFSRCRVSFRVEVRTRCGVLVDGSAEDLSLKGVLLKTERSLPLDAPVRVAILLDGPEGGYRVECEGTVARIDRRGVAIAFTAIDGDSLEHLRQVLRLNAEDADHADNEFLTHVGLKGPVRQES
ncbi:MAG TPA: PilZ domain-containing protein [Candidatus Hydrogenedentes bacterium]|nr:PilZ domain-containing protein [Candidatus Hydrogenedentota bacterium]